MAEQVIIDNPILNSPFEEPTRRSKSSEDGITNEIVEGRRVGAPEVEDEGEPFEEKFPRLVSKLYEQFGESPELEKTIRSNLERLGLLE